MQSVLILAVSQKYKIQSLSRPYLSKLVKMISNIHYRYWVEILSKADARTCSNESMHEKNQFLGVRSEISI